MLGGAAYYLYKSRRKVVEKVPTRMRRVVLVEANRDLHQARLEVEEVETPKPRNGQVLVKIAAAPINPSDDGIWRVPPKQGYPLPLGNEASGTVIASGGGFMASRLLGKNVAIIGAKTYAEYAVVDALQGAFCLPSDISVEDGCAFFINPFTVVGIVETVKESGSNVFIHTAAASQLGQMLVKYCKTQGVQVVNIVRRNDQADMLRKVGAEIIVVTSEAEWEIKLQKLIKDLNIKCAFDAVAGEMSGTLLTMLPPGGTVWVYGRLAPEPVGNIQPLDLIYRGKKIQGFMLTNWLFKGGRLKGLFRSMRAASKVRKFLKDIFSCTFKDTDMEAMHAHYCTLMAGGATGNKMRVRPHPV